MIEPAKDALQVTSLGMGGALAIFVLAASTPWKILRCYFMHTRYKSENLLSTKLRMTLLILNKALHNHQLEGNWEGGLTRIIP